MPTTPHGSLIRSRRITLGMSQARLGAKVGVSATTIRRWERGESVPGDDFLGTLAEALEVPVAALTPGAEPPRNSRLPSVSRIVPWLSWPML